MASLDFEEVLSLLNHSRTTHITPEPSSRSDAGWALHDGEHRVHTKAYPFRVLSLQSRVTREGIERASREAFRPADTQVVYAQSIDKRLSVHKELFGKSPSGFWTIKDYLRSFIKDELDKYISALKSLQPQFYIDPHVMVPAGFPRRTPNPVLSFLRETSEGKEEGELAVLLAEPGHGKTYMSRNLVSVLAGAPNSPVPILIDASQWQGMSVDDLGSLDRTIAHSFRHFDAPIGWLDGHEEQFLRVTLKADLFRIVFDGFDEYVLRNRGLVQPMAVVDALASLAKATGARILITSRRSFWYANIPEEEVARLSQGGGVHVFEILPFDPEHAKNYFKQRLTKLPLIAKADQIYATLRSQNDSIVGRGFVLSLIADLVSRFPETADAKLGESSAMTWLLTALCEREQLRQQLPLSAEDQLRTFTQFAADVAMGESASTATLEYALGVTRPELDGDTVENSIEKLKSHPLLEKDSAKDLWGFRQEQAEILLLAQRIIDVERGDLSPFVGRLRLDVGLRQDLSEAIVDIITDRELADVGKQKLGELVQGLIQGGGMGHGLNAENRRLGASILLAAVERLHPPRGSSHQERASLLVALAGGGAVGGFTFSGTMTRYDLRGVAFKKCAFDQVTWANCRFDDESLFLDCEFDGGGAMYCEGLGLAVFEKCHQDEEAIGWVSAAQIGAGRKRYGPEDLKADFAAVLGKFILKGGIGLRTVAEANLFKGRVSSSRFRTEIVDAIKANLVEPHHVSGMSDPGYGVRHEAEEAMKFYATNNVFTGPLASAFAELSRNLGLK